MRPFLVLIRKINLFVAIVVNVYGVVYSATMGRLPFALSKSPHCAKYAADTYNYGRQSPFIANRPRVSPSYNGDVFRVCRLRKHTIFLLARFAILHGPIYEAYQTPRVASGTCVTSSDIGSGKWAYVVAAVSLGFRFVASRWFR